MVHGQVSTPMQTTLILEKIAYRGFHHVFFFSKLSGSPTLNHVLERCMLAVMMHGSEILNRIWAPRENVTIFSKYGPLYYGKVTVIQISPTYLHTEIAKYFFCILRNHLK